jgi:tRNA(Ile)-lysidine synthase
MKWRNPSPASPKLELVRPLLDLSKKELKEFATKNHVLFREDASNASLDIQRNRIRHELLPLLRKRYQSALDRTIPRVMHILEAEAEFITQAAEAWLGLPGPVALKKQASIGFETLPLALQRRCVQLQLLQQGVTPEFDLVEQLRGSAGKSVNVPGRAQLQAIRDCCGRVTLREPEKPGPSHTSRLVEFRSGRGETVLDGVSLKWGIDAKGGLQRPKMRPGQEFFDADRVGSPIFLRYWRPGDQFQPIGMSQSVKLQDFFTNLKVPRRKRYELVLATTARGEVFWVEGLRISERFKLRKSTIRRLQWEWLRL